jgi:predicted Zn-dependent peptidase
MRRPTPFAAPAALALSALLASAPSLRAQKQAPPAGGPPKDFVVPQAATFTLPNGLAVTLVPYGTLPKATVRLEVRAGDVYEAPNEVSLADFTGRLMKEGTTTRTAEQVAAAASGMGGTLDVDVGQDQATIGGDVLGEFAPKMAALVADVAMHPALPESEVARLRADMLRDLSLRQAEPQTMTLAAFRKHLYPDHPYGRIFPTEAMLRSYTVADARRFYGANFGPARAHLYVSGRFDEKAVRAAVERAFGGWSGGGAGAAPAPKPVTARAVEVIDRPGAAQSTIYLGLPTIAPQDSDYTALLVTDALLGGSFISRITSNIREQKGYTYSPFSEVSTRAHDAYWVQTADVTTSVTGPALKEIYAEIRRLANEPPSAQELEGIQNYLAGTFVLRNSTRQGLINQLNFLDVQGLPRTYLTDFVRRVRAVTPADVQRIARTYLKPENMTLVVAGDRSKIDQQLQPYQSAVP